MSAYKEYSKADRSQALRLYKNGWGQLRIANVIGCYPSTVHRWLKDAKVKTRPGPSYSEKFRKKVIAEYLERTDLSMLKVARKNKVCQQTLHRWLDEAKVTSRSTRPCVYDREAIVADIEAGMKKADIAKKHGCSESWVYRVQAGG
jgi:transposase-like protein